MVTLRSETMVAGMTFAESYRFFDARVVDALRELGIDAWYAPLNDISSAAGKIGGARKRGVEEPCSITPPWPTT